MIGGCTTAGVAARPVGRRRRRRGAAVVAAVLAATAVLGTPTAATAQVMEVPVAVQIPLFLKTLAFDRELKKRAPTEIVFAVVYQGGHRPSVTARDEAVRALAAAAPVEGLPLRIVTIDLDRDTLVAALERERVTMLYITPVRGVDISAIGRSAQFAGATTFTGVARYISAGLAVGVRLQGDRPKLLINVDSARLEGAEFRAELLKLAQVVR